MAERTQHPQLMLWITWLVVQADGKIADDESLLFRHLTRLVRERHEIVDEQLAEYDREAASYIPIEELKAANDPRWNQLPERPEEFRAEVVAVMERIVAAHPGQRVAVVCHGGVINVVLHEILGTEKLLSFPIDYASVTVLRHSRRGTTSVAGVNGIEHVWDLLPRNRTTA